MKTPTPAIPDSFNTTEEEAKRLKLAPVTLEKDRAGKRLIPFVRIGKSIRYIPARTDAALLKLEEGGPFTRAKPTQNRGSKVPA